jgi:uncharacterized protein YndB with AHSA1/START domain
MPEPGRPVEITLVIAAGPQTIFRYFTHPARFARRMGQGSVLDPEPGGRLRVGYPTGQVAAGQVVAVEPARRAELLGRCLADGGRFRDPTGAVDGAGPLADHIGTVQRMTGGARLAGRGAPEACHGLARFGWAAVGPGEVVLATGTNVAGTDLDGRFRWVTGFWDPPTGSPAERPAESPEHPEQV